MNTRIFIVLASLFCIVFQINSQIVTECNGVVNPSNRLWKNYTQNSTTPTKLPIPIPTNITYPGLVKKSINANYTELNQAIQELVANKGGVISFKNTGTGKTILFNKAIDILNASTKPCVTILIEGNNNIKFDGQNTSSIFVARRSVKFIVQNATFQNARLKRGIIQNRTNRRTGGGAIETNAGAALRVYNCKFLNNAVDEWNDTPGGAYDGVGENQNGAAIRLNYHSTAEIFKCTFSNNKAVTGGAIGATSINKLTIMDSSFEKNVATAYNTKNSTNRRVVEGAGALRVDRTAKPIEIYRTNFSENAANIKASVMQVFIKPLRARNGSETGPYPTGAQIALIIDGCTFKNNKYYNFRNAVDAEKGEFFSGCIVFHSGNLKGPRMKITNSQFISNEVAESTLRTFLEFEISNSIFADTKFIRLKDKAGNVRTNGKGALMLRNEPNKGVIKNCTFYNNEPNPNDPVKLVASDIFFFKGTEAKYTLNNCLFVRKNKQKDVKQVSYPIKGSNNVQFIEGANMTLFDKVSTSNVKTTNPNINPNNISNMCLGANSLPENSGGLKNCNTNTTPPTAPTPPTTPPVVVTPPTNNSGIPIGKTIWLKANNGAAGYVSADIDVNRAPLRANRVNIGAWEQFKIEDAGNGKVHLKAMANNKYVQARLNEKSELLAVSNTKLGWETFTWENRANNKVALKAFNGKYVRARLSLDTKELGAVGDDVKGWEIFLWGVVAGSKRLDTVSKNESYNVYPNPSNATEPITVSGAKQGDVISIYTASGNPISPNNQTLNADLKVDVSTLQTGIYFVKINTTVSKLVID